MAMMECPNCGEQVSDKAKKCVHCGAVLIPEEKRYCQECGAELDAEADVCPKCGCPVENVKDSEATPQQVEVTGVKIAKKSKKIIAIAAVVILIVALIAVAVVQGQKKKEAEEAAKRMEEYSANLELVTYSMLSGAGDAETCGNLIKKSGTTQFMRSGMIRPINIPDQVVISYRILMMHYRIYIPILLSVFR